MTQFAHDTATPVTWPAYRGGGRPAGYDGERTSL